MRAGVPYLSSVTDVSELTGLDKQSFTNLLENGNFENWNNGVAAAPDGWTYAQGGAGGSVARESGNKKINAYSAKITKSNAGASELLSIPGMVDHFRLRGRKATFGVWIKSANTIADAIYVYIKDDTGSSSNSYYQNSGGWEFITITFDVDAAADEITAVCAVGSTANTVAYFEGAILVEGAVCPAFHGAPIIDTDFSADEGFMRKTGAGAYEVIKSNLSAAVAPTANDDSGDGYAIGSRWTDTTAKKEYVCLDATVAAAVWTETTVQDVSPRVAVGAANYNPSVLTTDCIIGVDNTAAARSVIISTEDVASGTAAIPRIMHVVDESGGAGLNNITITLENGGTISGAANAIINSNYNTISIYLTGTNGFIY